MSLNNNNRRPGGRILPVRRLTPQIDPQKQFAKLSLAINEIYRHNASQLSFEELYRTAYWMVLGKNGQLAYDGVRGVLETHLSESANQDIIQHAVGASQTSVTIFENEALLSAVRHLWSEHVTAMLIIKDILMYVDNVYVRSTQLPHIYEMGMSVFRDTVLLAEYHGHRLNIDVANAWLRQIAREREGEHINRGTLKRITGMFTALPARDRRTGGGSSSRSGESSNTTPTIYEAAVEPLVLNEAREFYRQQAGMRVKSLTTSEYVHAAQADIDAEMDRVATYMAPSTEDPLRSVMLDVLINTYAKDILEIPKAGLISILDQEDISTLAVIYNLYSPLESALVVLKELIHSHIFDIGSQITQSMTASLAAASNTPAASAPASKPGGGSNDAVGKTAAALRWVQEVIKLYDSYDAMLKKSFAEASTMRTTINDSFIEVINGNSRAPEFLSLSIDDILKNGFRRHGEQEVDHILERSVVLFRFLQNKDTFEHYYKVHLARRLMNVRGGLVANDAEHNLLSKLKVECGSQFTFKLEGMFKDMQVSADLCSRFRVENGEDKFGFDFNVSVLTPTFWPLSQASPSSSSTGVVAAGSKNADSETKRNAVIGIDSNGNQQRKSKLSRAADAYSDFYLSKHSGKRLAWHYGMGTADLRVTFGKRVHELNVSTYQMMILVLFAEEGEHTFTAAEIEGRTGIPHSHLVRHLQSLACGKYRVLTKTPKSREVNPGDLFAFNSGFKSQQYRIRIPVVSARNSNAVETEKEKETSMAAIIKERQYLIDATVVRIMKARMRMLHDQLVNETISQLSPRFRPTTKMIKDVIGSLIDREYIQRSSGDQREYIYQA